MSSSGAIVAELRRRAGLSQRLLAARAGCTRSTIVRIENGEMDPTVTMLARITTAAGYRLELDTAQAIGRHSLAAIASRPEPDDEIPWTMLRGLLDWLDLHPERTPEAIVDPPPRTGNEHFDNLLAGIAEKLADDHDLARPSWTDDVPLPTTDWQSPGTPTMRARERATTPAQLAARRVFIGTENLWRPRRG